MAKPTLSNEAPSTSQVYKSKHFAMFPKDGSCLGFLSIYMLLMMYV